MTTPQIGSGFLSRDADPFCSPSANDTNTPAIPLAIKRTTKSTFEMEWTSGKIAFQTKGPVQRKIKAPAMNPKNPLLFLQAFFEHQKVFVFGVAFQSLIEKSCRILLVPDL